MDTKTCVEEVALSNDANDHPKQTLLQPKPNKPNRKKSTFKWRTLWATYCQLFGYLILGGGFAVGHHFFYESLHGTVVSDILGFKQFNTQQLYLQVGTAISYFAQSCFGAAITAAYNQYAWARMRSKSHTVKALDSIFTGASNVLSFLKPAFVREAPICWLIAGCTLFMPLTSQFTQATLNVVQSSSAINKHMQVPILDFTNTSNFILPDLDSDDKTARAHYLSDPAQINPAFERIVYEAVSTAKILPMKVIHTNNTYNMTFTAPGLRCSSPTDPKIIDAMKAANERAAPSNSVWSQVFYVGGTIKSDDSTDDKRLFGIQFQGKMAVCENTDLKYSAKFTATSGSLQTITDVSAPHDKISGRQYDSKIYEAYNEYLVNMLNGSWYAVGYMADDNTTLEVKAVSDGADFISPALESLVMDYANSMRTAFTTFNGTRVKWLGNPYYVLPADRALQRNLGFVDLVEQMFRNITLSLFSNEEFWSLSRSNQILGTIDTLQTRYVYKRKTLTLTYGISFVLALFWTVVGLVCLLMNGISRGMSFSSIVATTRNKELDQLSRRECRTTDEGVAMEQLMDNAKLMFGIQNSEDGETPPRAGFGAHVTKVKSGQRL